MSCTVVYEAKYIYIGPVKDKTLKPMCGQIKSNFMTRITWTTIASSLFLWKKIVIWHEKAHKVVSRLLRKYRKASRIKIVLRILTQHANGNLHK